MRGRLHAPAHPGRITVHGGWALGGLLQRTDAPAEGCGHLDVSVRLIAETSGQHASRKRPAVPAGTSSTRIPARRRARLGAVQRWRRSHASECNDASSAPRRRPHSRGKRVRAMRCRRARLTRHPSASTDDRLTLASGGDCESADVVVTSADRPDRSTRPRRFALVLSSRSARRRSRGRLSISLGFHRPGGFGAYGLVARMPDRGRPDPPQPDLPEAQPALLPHAQRRCRRRARGWRRSRRLPRLRPGGIRPPSRGRLRTGPRRGVPGTRGTRLEHRQRAAP